jgi:2-oxoglutarate ferredoxin oxidoreductase subunit beta
MARLISEAIEHRGFSFLHVLSQCITFCPEQTDWKGIVREREEAPLTDAAEAARLFFGESGFDTGLLYAQPRDTWPPEREHRLQSLDEIAGRFRT